MDNPPESMSRQQLVREVRDSRKKQHQAEKEGQQSVGWLKKLSDGINIGNRFSVRNIITNGVQKLPLEVQQPILAAKRDIGDYDTDDEQDVVKIPQKDKKKWSWKTRMLIFLGLAILIIAMYFLVKGGFFTGVLTSLKDFVFPLMKELILSCVDWIVDVCSNAWAYFFG